MSCFFSSFDLQSSIILQAILIPGLPWASRLFSSLFLWLPVLLPLCPPILSASASQASPSTSSKPLLKSLALLRDPPNLRSSWLEAVQLTIDCAHQYWLGLKRLLLLPPPPLLSHWSFSYILKHFLLDPWCPAPPLASWPSVVRGLTVDLAQWRALAFVP